MLAMTFNELINYQWLGNDLWRWAALLGTIIVSLAVGKLLYLLLSSQVKRLDDIQGRFIISSMILRSISRPLPMFSLGVGLYLVGAFVMNLGYTLDEKVVDGKRVAVTLQDWWDKGCATIIILSIAWFVYAMVDIVELMLHKITGRTDTLLDDQLVPILRKSIRVFVVLLFALFLAQNVYQWDIGAVIAGLGIGGLAFALAAKDMLSNLFGSVTIFADRPFTMGDRIQIQGYDGMVEQVGFRSTRLRLLSGNQVTIPNSIMANEPVENIGRRPSIKRVLDVTVTYDTPPEKVQRGVEILREMLAARMEHFPADYPPRVYFNDFHSTSLSIIVYYWFNPPEWWDYLEFNHDFNMELLRRFNEEGIEFAFPTQTLYVKQDSPIEASINNADTTS